MSTTILTYTNEKILRDADPNHLADVLRNVDLATFVLNMATPVTEDVTLDASLNATLSKVPVGQVRAFKKTDATKSQTHVANGATLQASQFSVDLDTRIATFEATDLANTNVVVLEYIGLAADSTGAAGTAMAEDLAANFRLGDGN